MSNIFSNKKAATGETVEDDHIGGGGLLDTGIYAGTIKYAYIGKAQSSDARNLTLSVTVDGREVRQTIWMTNRNGDITYKDKKTGDPKNLPGFNQVNALALLVAGVEVGNLEVEEKVLNLYDFESKKEVPTSVDCFTELHGQDIQVAIQRQIVDKTEKADDGSYVANGETRELNEIIKFFPGSARVTISEVEQYCKSLGAEFSEVVADGDLLKAIERMTDENGAYATAWLEKFEGETYDKSKGKSEGKVFKGSKSSGGEKKSKSSLFDD